ncbi:MAG: alanine racemase [Dissulfurimicrobium sp.]|uniref:alanine racemase n=1 Tax=Dissulfurimicrobium sp. TaxID=2022436 RepID=UPI004049F3EC
MSYQELNRIEIDLAALSHNFRALKSMVGQEIGVIAVVKSDAYGHGLIEVARQLTLDGASAFAVFDLNEAAILRKAGINTPILLLSGIAPADEGACLELGLICGVISSQMLDALEQEAKRRGKKAYVHLKTDIGMGRVGFDKEELLCIVKDRERWPDIEMLGLYSHLSSADEPDDPVNKAQISAFRHIIEEVERIGWRPDVIHLANSAGLIHFQDARFNAVRPGLALYGGYPGENSIGRIHLKPVMSLKSRVISVKRLPIGATVSYGHTFITRRASKIAVIPIGYDDGYLRALSGKAEVLIRGRRLPVLGRICMKSMIVDVTDINGAAPGEEVVLLGRQGGDEITIEDLAKRAGTISYELFCLLGTRNRRYFKRG